MKSRFTSLLSTNYVPSNDELDEIHKLLVDPVDRLNQLDTEITRLQSAIDKITRKRNQLHADIVRHRNLMAPLRRIPEELLQEIFFHCLPVDHNAVMSCHEAPLLLGRVCSYWRSVSQSTPCLWSDIHIVIPSSLPPVAGQGLPDTVDEKHDTWEAVEAWLNRSGDLPLSISLFQAPYAFTSPDLLEHFMSTLIQFSARWRDVSLIISPPICSQLSSVSHKTLPLLEKISFHATHGPSPLSEFAPLDIFRAPHLRTVLSYRLGAIPRDMDWSRLTSLCLESRGHGEGMLTPSRAINILRESPNLIHCELDFAGGWGDSHPSDNHGAVTMSSLETLSIHEGVLPLKPLYEQLRLPVLVDLEFAASSPRQRFEIDVPEEPSICILLSRLDSLKGLTLSALDLSHTTLMSCLRHAPSITRLSVLRPFQPDYWPFFGEVWSPCTDEVASLLTPTKGQPTVCPLLKVLECSPCGVSDAVLLALIQQRTTYALTHDVHPLERVDIAIYRQNEIDIPSVLPPYVLERTMLSLQYLTPPVVHRPNIPRAGLEKPDRLQIPTNMYRYLYH